MAVVLVVEDDATIGELLESALTSHGYTTSWQRSGSSAVAEASVRAFDLVLLDLGLPDVDGVDVCRRLKLTQPDLVVVMLTARREEMDVVVGLESGADDYVVKPFGMSELMARIRAHLRRVVSPEQADPVLVLDDLQVDTDARRCSVRGHEVHLRTKELDLLVRLMTSPGQAVSRTRLMSDVWDENWFGSTKTLDVHVAAVRGKLRSAAAELDPPGLVPTIETLRGFGYRLQAAQDP